MQLHWPITVDQQHRLKKELFAGLLRGVVSLASSSLLERVPSLVWLRVKDSKVGGGCSYSSSKVCFRRRCFSESCFSSIYAIL